MPADTPLWHCVSCDDIVFFQTSDYPVGYACYCTSLAHVAMTDKCLLNALLNLSICLTQQVFQAIKCSGAIAELVSPVSQITTLITGLDWSYQIGGYTRADRGSIIRSVLSG